MTTPLSLGPLGQVSLLVTDIARSERFYRDTMGLPHLFTFGDIAFFDCHGVRLYLRAVAPDAWQPGSILYFRTDAIDDAFRALGAAGVNTQAQPHLIHRHAESGDEEWMAFFEDPDGNTLALMTRLAGTET